MRKYKLPYLAALVLALLLAACGRADTRESRESVTLWYVEGDPAAAALDALARQYDETAEKELLRVTLRALPDEESL
ncbi:MAG: hypothetical protein IJ594_04105, partial [Oscillospiraceae bacterium]|nr:hypothetical protein [Oscillospiraceae bacterium]